MTDKQLEYILVIANEGNITRAANKLFISQSSLSQLLSHVESELDVELFSRDVSPLAPTYAGELFLKSAAQVLEIKKNLLTKYAELKNQKSGRIHIGMSQDRSWIFTPLILPDFVKQYPDVEIVFSEGSQQQLTEMLLQRKIDLIFTVDPPILSQLNYYTLFSEQMILTVPVDNPICAHLRSGTNLEPALFTDTPFILTRQGNNLRTLTDQILSDAKISPKILLETHSMDVCLHMSAYGLGASIIPDTLYYFRDPHNQVFAYPLDEKYNRDISIAYRKEMYLPFIMNEFIRIATANLLLARHFSIYRRPDSVF